MTKKSKIYNTILLLQKMVKYIIVCRITYVLEGNIAKNNINILKLLAIVKELAI